jgi:phosphohistidine phosphatase
MQRLILMRHGKAERAGLGVEDSERHLTDRGVADARIMGRVLKENGLIPDLALVSSAARTQETWTAVSEAFPRARIQVRQGLYLAGTSHLRQTVELMAEANETLMVVAHNPGLHDLALRLLADSSAPPSVMAKLAGGFPTSTAVAFTVDAAGRYQYDGIFYVRDYGGGGHE